jgi:Zn-dependent protease
VLFAASSLREAHPLAALAINSALFVNFFWTFLNLLPIQPLDGGQILRELLGPSRIQITSWIGFCVAVAVCIWAFVNEQFFLAFMLALLAYYNFRRDSVEGGVITG